METLGLYKKNMAINIILSTKKKKDKNKNKIRTETWYLPEG